MESLKFRLGKIDEKRNYLIDETKHNDLMLAKYKKTYKYLKYVEHLFILILTVTSCISIAAFASLVYVLFGITSSAVEVKLSAIAAGIKKYK